MTKNNIFELIKLILKIIILNNFNGVNLNKKFEDLFENFERPGYMDFEKSVIKIDENPDLCGGNKKNGSKYFILDKYSGSMYPLKCFWIIAFLKCNNLKNDESYQKFGKMVSSADLISELEFFGITTNSKKEDIRFKIIKK